MIISDLQYLESAENFELQGGKCGYAKVTGNIKAQTPSTQASRDEINALIPPTRFIDTFVEPDAKVGLRGGGGRGGK